MSKADDLLDLDRVLAAALHDPIAVDPDLRHASNANALRPPLRPDPGATRVDLAPPAPVVPRTRRHAPRPTAGCPDCRARASA